jgi:hypothetical protein
MSAATTTTRDVGLAPSSGEAEPLKTVRRGGETASLPPPSIEGARAGDPDPVEFDTLDRHSDAVRETFIPITKTALIDRLTLPVAWAPGEHRNARRFF